MRARSTGPGQLSACRSSSIADSPSPNGQLKKLLPRGRLSRQYRRRQGWMSPCPPPPKEHRIRCRRMSGRWSCSGTGSPPIHRGFPITTARWPHAGVARPRSPESGSSRTSATLDYILCSSAARTRQTLEATGLATPTALVDVSSSIYEAYPEELLELVTAAPPADRTAPAGGSCAGSAGSRRNAGRTRIEHRRPARHGNQVSDVRDRGSRCRGSVGRRRRGRRATG